MQTVQKQSTSTAQSQTGQKQTAQSQTGQKQTGQSQTAQSQTGQSQTGQSQTAQKPANPEPSAQGSSDHRRSVQHFLDRLGQCLTAGRADVVAKMWEAPAFVMADQMVQVVATAKEVENFFANARTDYNQRGVVDTRADILREQWITARMVIVDVRWPHLDGQGQEVGTETSTYVLRVDDDGALRLRTAIMHGAQDADGADMS